jgi:molybdopterin converting factor small subunit
MPEFLRPKGPGDKEKEQLSPEESKEREPEDVQYSVADLATLIEIMPEEYKPFRTLLAKALVTAIPWVSHENWEKIEGWENPVKDGDFIDVTATLDARINREKENRSYSDYAAELLRREFGSTKLSVEKLHYFIETVSFGVTAGRPQAEHIERTLFGEGWFDKLENLLVGIEPIVKEINKIREELREILKTVIPSSSKPEESSPEKIQEYRRQLVRQQVMDMFTLSDSGYIPKDGKTLWEVLKNICPGYVEDKRKLEELLILYMDLYEKLTGLPFDPENQITTGPFTEEQLDIIIDSIAKSNLSIQGETIQEEKEEDEIDLFLRKIDYTTIDPSIASKIDELKKRLEELNKQLVEKFKEYFPIEKSQ